MGPGVLARAGHSPQGSVGTAGRDHDLRQERVQKAQSRPCAPLKSTVPHLRCHTYTTKTQLLISTQTLLLPFYFSVNGTTIHPMGQNLKVFLDSLVNFSTPQQPILHLHPTPKHIPTPNTSFRPPSTTLVQASIASATASLQSILHTAARASS